MTTSESLLRIAGLALVALVASRPAVAQNDRLSTAPLTLDNFVRAWEAAPFARYFLNTVLLVTLVLAGQLVLSTLAAYAFARYRFFGREVAFALVLVQLMIMPDVLLFELNVPTRIAYFFGGTGMLITVGVILDTMRQIESQLSMRSYKGFLK